jgi:hypothetical protein
MQSQRSNNLIAYALGIATGCALARAEAAEANAKLARVREALRWTRAYVPSHHGEARTRARDAWKETR